jgi:protein-disulfide isomerase
VRRFCATEASGETVIKSRRLHAAAALWAVLCACSTSATKQPAAGRSATFIDPGTQVAVIDGQPVTYGDIEKEIGSKVRQAEAEYLTKVYDLRREALEGLLSKRLVEAEAKKVNKTSDEWFRDYLAGAPTPGDAELKAFYDQNQAQMGGRGFEEMKPRIAGFMKQQGAKESLGKFLEALKQTHGVKVSLAAPDLPRIEVDAKGPARGVPAAKVTIVAFSDFQCPYCSRVLPTLEKVMKEYDGKVKLVFRNFPLDFHPMAAKAAEAGACAADQGKFWEMHDKMFGNQQKLTVDDLKASAKELGLDAAKFNKCLDSGEKKAAVDADQKAGAEAGVQGTPAFFINGLFINGAQPYEQFKDTIDRELTKG